MFAIHRATATTPASRTRPSSQPGHFALHYVEMCAAMCIGFAVGDALYFWVASLAGYSRPFSELPVLSLTLVTLFMTAPMTAWMRYRGMPRRAIIEMSASMPITPRSNSIPEPAARPLTMPAATRSGRRAARRSRA